MGFSAEQGIITLNTSIGNQSVTSLSFQPEIVLFFGTENTADGVVVDQNIFLGAAISSSEQICAGGGDEDAQTPSDSNRLILTDACMRLQVPGESSTARVIATFVTQLSNGFTIDITTAPSSAYRIGFLALGGTDLTGVKIGTFNPSGNTGPQAIYGVGFAADGFIFLDANDSVSGSPSSGQSFSMGFAVSSSQRGWLGIQSEDADPTDTHYRQQADNCFGSLNFTGGVLNGLADFVSVGSNDFTFNWSTAGDSGNDVGYIAFKGIQCAVGSFNTQTSTGNFSITSLSFQGIAGIFASFCAPTNGSTLDGNKISLGIATSSSQRFVVGGVSEDNVSGSSDCDQYQDDGLIYHNYDYNQTVLGAIDFVSWLSNGFQLNQTDADPAANEVLFLIFGAAATPPTPPASYETITHQNTVTGSDGGATTVDTDLITPSGSNTILVAKISYKDTTFEISDVRWRTSGDAGDQLSVLRNAEENGNARTAIYYLVNPAQAERFVRATFNASQRVAISASIYTGVDQDDPWFSNTGYDGTDNSPTVVVSGGNIQLTIDSLCQVSAGPDTATADHTPRANLAATGGGTDTRHASQEKLNASAMGWSMSDADNWALSTGTLQPAGVPGVISIPIIMHHRKMIGVS